jgi:hypothetical protein
MQKLKQMSEGRSRLIIQVTHHEEDADGVRVYTLGRGLDAPGRGPPVLWHQAKRVLEDLAKQPGWAKGRPVFRTLVDERDPDPGLVHGWNDGGDRDWARASSLPNDAAHAGGELGGSVRDIGS